MCTCCHGNKYGICVYVVMVTDRLVWYMCTCCHGTDLLVWDMCTCCHGNKYGISVHVVMATSMGYVYMLLW